MTTLLVVDGIASKDMFYFILSGWVLIKYKTQSFLDATD